MNGLSMGRPPRWLAERSSLLLMAIVFAVVILGPMMLGACGCTMFSLAAGGLVLAAALLVGNTGFGALTGEREKKTLDSLRLTQLTANQVVLGKISGELTLLGRLLLVGGPTVLAAAAMSDYGLMTGVVALGLAGLAGVFAAVYGIFVSSLFDTTSRAVVGGWIGKAVWLLLTPVLDGVLAAVMVQRTGPPLFSSLNPAAALSVLLVPEGAHGVREFLPLLAFPAIAAAIAFMWHVTARRFDSGLVAGGGVSDRRMHHVYRQGWGPAWLQEKVPALRTNPSFLRELVLQLRSGAGRWPGYAVFIVLFLAPFIYAKSWAVKDTVRSFEDRSTRPVVRVDNSTPVFSGHDKVTSETPRQVGLRMIDGTRLVLKNHSPHLCMRLALNRVAGMPLPEGSLRVVVEPQAHFYSCHRGKDEPVTGVTERPLDSGTAARLGFDRHDGESDRAVMTSLAERRIQDKSLALGIAGTIVLLLIYLAIRCSGFLATAVTGERDRRSWEDLALTGISTDKTLAGKLGGALLLPLLQMTVSFPVMLFFVYNGSLSLFEVGGLYLYAVALAVTAGMLGLWASAVSPTSHEAHARALMLVLVGFTIVPMIAPSLGMVAGLAAVGMGVLSLAHNARFAQAAAWVGLGTSLLITPKVASPLTAVLTFTPSLVNTRVAFLQMLNPQMVTVGAAIINLMAALMFLASVAYLLWRASLARLGEGAQEDALRAELAH